jgi:hypothetical protein
MVPKDGYRFSEKIMLEQKPGWDDDSKKSHPALVGAAEAPITVSIETQPHAIVARILSTLAMVEDVRNP